MSEGSPAIGSPNVRKKTVLEDISNFRPVADLASQQQRSFVSSLIQNQDSKILRRIPGKKDFSAQES